MHSFIHDGKRHDPNNNTPFVSSKTHFSLPVVAAAKRNAESGKMHERIFYFPCDFKIQNKFNFT
jgi:hypothetical protein